jgi:hypothetical protein
LIIPDPDPGSGYRILTFYPSRIPDPRVKNAPDAGSGSATLLTRCSFPYLVLLNGVGVVDTAVVLADPEVILLVDTVLDHVPAHEKEYNNNVDWHSGG